VAPVHPVSVNTCELLSNQWGSRLLNETQLEIQGLPQIAGELFVNLKQTKLSKWAVSRVDFDSSQEDHACSLDRPIEFVSWRTYLNKISLALLYLDGVGFDSPAAEWPKVRGLRSTRSNQSSCLPPQAATWVYNIIIVATIWPAFCTLHTLVSILEHARSRSYCCALPLCFINSITDDSHQQRQHNFDNATNFVANFTQHQYPPDLTYKQMTSNKKRDSRPTICIAAH